PAAGGRDPHPHRRARPGGDLMRGILLCDDLIDASRVAASARAAGAELVTARTAEQLLRAAEERPGCVIVDLQSTADVAALVGELKCRFDPPPRVVGYGPHVAAALLKAARQAGCDPVMPRSQFFERLDDHM